LATAARGTVSRRALDKRAREIILAGERSRSETERHVVARSSARAEKRFFARRWGIRTSAVTRLRRILFRGGNRGLARGGTRQALNR